MLVPPSPTNDTATQDAPVIAEASAAPTAMGAPAPTTALAPSMPRLKSAMCIVPPLPRQRPSVEPQSSSIMAAGSQPLARQWPWPRCVLMMRSSSVKCSQTPTAMASIPA
jgi:hypothetical protein